jgi:hypothetical protein
MFSDDLFDLLGGDASSPAAVAAGEQTTTTTTTTTSITPPTVRTTSCSRGGEEDGGTTTPTTASPIQVATSTSSSEEQQQPCCDSTETNAPEQEEQSSTSTCSPIIIRDGIPQAISNAEICVSDYTGTWKEVQTVYLMMMTMMTMNPLEEHTSPTLLFAYQKDQSREEIRIPYGSIIFGVRLERQPYGSSFQEPAPKDVASSLVLILQIQKTEYYHHYYYESSSASSSSYENGKGLLWQLEECRLETLQDEDYIYQIFKRTKQVMSRLREILLLPDNEDVQGLLEEEEDDEEEERAYYSDRFPDAPLLLHADGGKVPVSHEAEEEDDVAFLVRTKEQTVEWLNNAYA